jgi:hypothetical protein
MMDIDQMKINGNAVVLITMLLDDQVKKRNRILD